MTSVQPQQISPLTSLTPVTGTSGKPRIPQRDGQNPAELSFRQQTLWYLYQLDPDNPAYNVAFLLHFDGPLRLSVMERSLNEIVRRHDSLHTRISLIDGHVFQVIASPEPFSLELVDLSDQVDGESQLRTIAQTEARRPFHLEHEPLIRFRLLKLAHDRHILFFNLHHIIADQWSVQILLQELVTLYPAFNAGKPSPLGEIAVQYPDFSDWQRQQLQGDYLHKQQSYWKQRLNDAPVELNLPTDFPMTQPPRDGNVHPVHLSPKLVDDLTRLGRSCGATPFMVIMAAFQILLHRYSNQSDVVVGFPISARPYRELESVIGYFANTLVLRSSFAENPTVQDLLRQVKKSALSAYTHQALPFEKIVEVINPPRNQCRNPIFQALLVLQNTPLANLQLPGVELRLEQLHNGTAKFDISLELHEAEGGLKGWFEYRMDVFKPETIARLADQFELLLTSMIANPDKIANQLPFLGVEECHQILCDWARSTDIPVDRCVHDWFELQVQRQPQAIALRWRGQTMTYAELNRQANQLAHCLAERGVTTEQVVGVCLERSFAQIVTILAVVKAGGAYLPLDPGYPSARLQHMLQDASPALIVTQASLQNVLPDVAGAYLQWETLESTIATYPDSNLPGCTKPSNLIYIPYTSGSTGTPKGVEVCHRGIVRLVIEPNYLDIQASDRFLQVSPVAFDASLLELWGSLLNGATLVIYPETTFTLAELGTVMRAEQITTLWLTAGLFQLMVEERLQDLSHVRYLLSGGDRLSVPHVRRVLEQLPQCQLINGYGPTESTTFTACYPIQHSSDIEQGVPIGRPINNTQVYVLNEYQQPVPVGVSGELYVGGDGLARGYRNQPERTAERFVPNPFSLDPEARLYRTGDLVRFRNDGVLEFLGRSDRQVKIRGFRVEPGEIETVLSQHPQVAQSYVTCQTIANDKKLIGYVVPVPGETLPVDELLQFLRQRLPDYLLPNGIQLLEQLPLTPNGKVDQAALPVPDTVTSTHAYVGPTTDVQQRLAAIWETLLGVQPIGIYDNFWDLGGHSLLAVSLFARIADEFGLHLPLATLFNAPTIDALSNLLTAQHSDSQAAPVSFGKSLIPIQPHGSKRPFFCVHGAGGNPLVFRELAQQLDSEQPFYALQLPGLDGRSTPYNSLSEMAAAYLEEVQQLQPEGPYLLGGFSFGGLVAFEMAQQLSAKGQPVDQLVLFDTGISSTSKSLWNRMKQSLQQLQTQGLQRVPILLASLRNYVQWRLRWLRARCMRAIFAPINRPLPHQWQKDYAVEVCDRAAEHYVPNPYDGSVVLFYSTQTSSPFEQPLSERWRQLVGVGLSVYAVESDHIELLSGTAVVQLARQLQTCLDASLTHSSDL